MDQVSIGQMLPKSDVSDLFLSSSTFFTLSSISVSLDSMHQFPLLVFLDITTVKASSDPLSNLSTSTSTDSEVEVDKLDSGSEDAFTIVMSRKTKRGNWCMLSRLTEMLDNVKNVLDDRNISDTSDSGNILSIVYHTMAYALK